MWWTTGISLWLIASVVITVGATLLSREAPEFRPGVPTAILFNLSTLTCALVIPPFRYRRWRYELRERDVFLAKGTIFFQMILVPFDRIQYVETRQGPLDRFFSLAQIHVYTAAGRAAQIPGLALPEAERLREELSKVAGTSSV